MSNRGFTLMEVMVVITIIGLLAGVVLSSVNSARNSARVATAKAELRSIRSAIALLEADTGKWPNGCAANLTSGNSEVNLSSSAAGLSSFPPLGSLPMTTDSAANPPCGWTAADFAAWRGPYTSADTDPWGSPYYWDPDYDLNDSDRSSCSSSLGTVPVIHSPGPNMSGINDYECDDIVYVLNGGTFAP